MGTADSGTTGTLVDAELANPAWGADYFNEALYRLYIYAGTNIGLERFVTDWVASSTATSYQLTLAPGYSAAPTTSSKYELHRIFWASEYLKAINLAIEAAAGKYLIDIKDETTIRLTSTTDNLDNTVYTWEYALPLSMLYLYRVITEEALEGVKLTGTVSYSAGGDFTAGETITGSVSGATGEFTYDGSTYIRLRKVSGTFTTGEDADGATASCESLTAVDSETAGGGRFLDKDIIDPRYYSIIRAYAPKLKLNKDYYDIDEDLYLRLEGQGTQPIVDDDADIIYLPPDWLVNKAITFLPKNKIESNKLDDVYRKAVIDSARIPYTWPNPKARRVVE